MNKKATLGPQTMIFLFIINLILIALGIIWGISSFFTSEYDFRGIDSTLLTERIKQCLTQNDIPFSDDTIQFEKEFYTTCGISKHVIEQNFFIIIKYNDEQVYEAGPGDETQCILSEKNKEFPVCTDAFIESKNIYIQTGSNQRAKRVRVV